MLKNLLVPLTGFESDARAPRRHAPLPRPSAAWNSDWSRRRGNQAPTSLLPAPTAIAAFGELVFGGFTREVLTACDLPILLLH